MIGIYVPKYKVGDILTCKFTYVVICVGQYKAIKLAFNLSDFDNKKYTEEDFVYIIKRLDFEKDVNVNWMICKGVDSDPNWKYEENYIKELVKQRIKQEVKEEDNNDETI